LLGKSYFRPAARKKYTLAQKEAIACIYRIAFFILVEAIAPWQVVFLEN